MARISFIVDYSQGATGNGKITFSVGAESREVDATGRLDSIGSRVDSLEPIEGLVSTGTEVTIECIRTSETAMRVVVRFKNETVSFEADGSYFARTLERVVEDVPLNFGP